MSKKRYILLFAFVAIVFLTTIMASSILFRPYATHKIVKPINCFSCHANELKDLAIGDHIRMMYGGQSKTLYDYLNLYGNTTDIFEAMYSLEGSCYSCHITYGSFNRFGLTDPYTFFKPGSSNSVVEAQYGYIINWNGTNSTEYINNINNTSNTSIHVELEILDISPTNFSVDTTLKISFVNYSGQQIGNNIFDSNAVLNDGDTMVIDIVNISEDYFKIILLLDGLWNNTLVNLRINGTDKGSESFFITSGIRPFVYELPLNSTGAYFFKTNGTYRAVRLDYVWTEWSSYALDKISSSELMRMSNSTNLNSMGSNFANFTNGINIKTSNNVSWTSGYTCGSPQGMCHILQKTTYMGLMDGLNSDKSLYSHNTDFVTSKQCKLCHLKNSFVGLGSTNCIGCHQSQQGPYVAIDMALFSRHKNVNIDGGLTNEDCKACHYDTSNMKEPGFTVATRNCVDCHTGAGSFNAPFMAEHSEAGQDIVTSSATCVSCHDNNGMIENNSTNIAHYVKQVTDKTTTPYGHLGPIDTSNCIECHNGPYTEDPNWGSPTNISTSTNRRHTETQTSQCDNCHNDGSIQSMILVDFHDASIKKG